MRSSEISGVKRKMVVAMVASALLGTSAVAQDAPVKLGVLTDMSSLYADNGGQGSAVAAQMAVDDFGGKVLGRSIQIVASDHQNKADVGAAIARRWLDNEGVEAILDVPNSAVALAVQGIARDKKKLFLATGAATSRLTGDECSLTGIHWTYDTYALSQGTAKAISRLGAKSWFFLSADYSLGAQLEADSRKVIEATGGKVVGAVKHPVNTPDFSSFLLQAQSSKADVIALADAGGDFINAVKQAGEFGITRQQKLAGLIVFIADIHSLGLPSAKGLMLSSAFYWDLNNETREWSKRFVDKTQKVPTMIHAGTYGAVAHYLRAVEAAGTLDGPTVAARMREMPVNDFMTKNGRIRQDGRLIRDMYLFRVKSPEESKYRFDYYELLANIPGEEAFRPMEEGGCPLLRKP
ncbi:ABC transporter substrate-binding protein [Bradyrhizobium sp. 182]|uniref:ABC transporter substrate-binding protein n=2 Tax=Bradyrhizobium TaxID=374 RepID=UPI001FFA6062|nr:ABC transporter substrate-binding protein [Bradyrhizobium sp. 153]MCK1419741.1 ABC transporter substrate-binding protein [Bradyrhizobium sp. CW12]MCK1530801.1 ABC transporter substrate-binding protein [Bradyrhizobium sp. 182]MCK1646394.1 ABC transporter substrate-binding protein [Bradyrhizobium sp. 154]MCK1665727.1 ABC transporter substrate-binding protein [Bradyrhizobium sp. 153]